MRPWWPSDSHDTSDCGPPDRSGVFGGAVSGLISLLAEAKVLFMVRIANLSTTPLSRVIVSTTSSDHDDGRREAKRRDPIELSHQETDQPCG